MMLSSVIPDDGAGSLLRKAAGQGYADAVLAIGVMFANSFVCGNGPQGTL
jgi:hypothetical protein